MSDPDANPDHSAAWFAAGAAAVAFNAPLSMSRADGLVTALARHSPARVVDLGCGRGRLATMVAAELPNATVTGIDLDQRHIDHANQQARDAGLADRLRFVVDDASTWPARGNPIDGPTTDGVIAVGVSHAFGGPQPMFEQLASVVAEGCAVVGDGVWQGEPSPWCQETFGQLPDGVTGLSEAAEAAGWAVIDADLSTLDEWDHFETAWGDGVRSLGDRDGSQFADRRAAEYANYRGVLGFAWLVLNR